MNLRQLNRILLQTLLVPVVALMFVATVLALQIRKAELTVERMQQDSTNISTATRVSTLIADEENGVRGYQLTSNEIFLQPYLFAQTPLSNAVAELRAGLLQQGSSPQPVDDFIQSHETWQIAFADPLITATENGLDTHDAGLNLRAKAQMDHLSDMIERIIDQQKVQRTQTIDTWRHQVRETLEVLIGLSLLIGLAIGVSARNRLHQVSLAFQGTLEALRRNAQRTYDSEQRLRTMLTSIGEGIIVCDLEGKVEILNTVAQELTGWHQSEALHQPIDRIFHLVEESTRTPLDSPVTSVQKLNGAACLSNRALLLRRDGTEFPVEDSGAPIYDQSGKLAGVVVVFRDISEQRRAQNALLATEKLAVAGRLAATLAHEIHNPLDAVINLLYLMKSNPTHEETAQFLDLASLELDRISQVSRAMLGMYRESKTPMAVDVQEMLESILLLLDRQMRQKQVALQTDFAPNAIVTGFPAELRQVFINLLTNAAEASPAGSLIDVHTELRSATRATVHTEAAPAGVAIIVSDNGSGIPSDVLPKLFQPFFTTKGEHGTGLGLWVSQGIVEKHGGRITITSDDTPTNHGTTVTVFLPRGNAA